ncbi:bifunctional Cyclophilin-type peptidyl-prolyl cis-trans isomerase domain/mRNA splicing factor SYF2/Cyclophilin-like domain superfamily [Babesia duncani]|uniref:Bifunctional Cyclophilin-type peptidyl-prolyl cis-trans isomerase domain/mRNA splicing factor SYF2/Cyclophilin-like domain superfamily n=1 Tax=Babesia duncani TaxID=323732 RepID=A0AAD9UML2_9APIC|nr:bifunctional Cyclophilin-type peptidyl-prolyl cis-trans isomerase domain/mRNA splicing factor SYF2/Cyclophilin-like domain superfamily [Babesia duncani]
MALDYRIYLDIGIGANLRGRIEFELFPDASDCLIENFFGLCNGTVETLVRGKKRKLSFKGSKFFEIVEGEYIRGGDIQHNNGEGGESIYGSYFKEKPNTRRHSLAGLLSMHRMPSGGFGSQFYITLGMSIKLDNEAIVIGKVVSGMEFVRALEFVPTDSRFRPTVECGILSCGSIDIVVASKKDNMSGQRALVSELMENVDKDENEGKPRVIEIKNPYSNRIIRKRLPNEKTASSIGKSMLQEALNGIIHHYVDLPVTPQNSSDDEKPEICAPEEPQRSSDESDDDSDNDNGDNFALAKLRMLRAKMKECSKLNNKGIIIESKVSDKSDNSTVGLNESKGEIEFNLSSELNCPAIAFAKTEKLQRKREKNKTFGWNVFNQDALYRAHKKRLSETPFNKSEYEYQKAQLGDDFYNPNLVHHTATEAAKKLNRIFFAKMGDGYSAAEIFDSVIGYTYDEIILMPGNKYNKIHMDKYRFHFSPCEQR